MTSNKWFYPALIVSALVVIPALLLVLAGTLTYSTLPSLDVLTDYRPKIPLRVYSAEGALIGEFGEERRALVRMENVPAIMKNAILAAEDDRFYSHGGVDYLGVLRAAMLNFTAGGAKQGASTITMQVARNFFLSKEKTFTRKFNEILLAFKIEHNLTKDEILQLYINQIYLGQRAYGFASAAQIYFGKSLAQLTVAEAAMLAGLPKAPSAYNPVVNPKRAKLRQMYVLRRMAELKFISPEQLQLAQTETLNTKHSSQEFPVHASHVAEMVRQVMYARYQDDIYSSGLNVYTTIRQEDQNAAYLALRKGVLDYDARHGYRGPEGYVDIKGEHSDEFMEDALQDSTDADDLIPAVVQSATEKSLRAYARGGKFVELSGDGLRFAQRSLSDKVALNQRIRAGSIIRVRLNEKGVWAITQMPQVESSFVSGNPSNGAIYSLVGGFDFNRNQFNHITQAWRQPGSSFKPFIYSSSLEKGYTPASIFNDAPLSFSAAQTGSEPWQPKNYDGTFDGPMSMRKALTKSKNMVSIRIMQAVGAEYAQDYVTKFGFDKDKVPPYLTTALGAVSVTPLQMFGGYSVFANGGYRVLPYFIDRIEDAKGQLIQKFTTTTAGVDAEAIIDVRNAFTMVNMMQDVVRHGTAIRAMTLGRSDLAGKTGTTSDSMDAWFCGFQPTIVGIAWMGYDTPKSLGDHETGGGAALPIWIDYMAKVLKNVPEASYTMPENMVAIQNSDKTEYYYQENSPSNAKSAGTPSFSE
ncbi:MAG: hypothetical protein RLZZ144_863 [Pseudomonadota bacterium]|jgi:penicillin-binding protein 1A